MLFCVQTHNVDLCTIEGPDYRIKVFLRAQLQEVDLCRIDGFH